MALMLICRMLTKLLSWMALSARSYATFTNGLIDQRGAVPAGFISAIGSRNYGEHGSYVPDQRSSAGLA